MAYIKQKEILQQKNPRILNPGINPIFRLGIFCKNQNPHKNSADFHS